MDEKIKMLFKYGILFVFITILIFACFMNFGSVLVFLEILIDIMMPLIIGCMMAVVLNVPMCGFQRLLLLIPKKIGKKVNENVINAVSLVLTLLSAFLLIFLVFSVVVPQIVESIKSIGETFLNYYPTLIKSLKHYGVDTSKIENIMKILNLDQLVDQVTNNASTIVNTAFSAATSVFGAVFNAFTGFIIAVYLLASKKKFARQSKKLLYAYVNKHKADVICNIAALSNKTFFHFISGQCLEACILGMLVFICMSIFGVFGYPLPYVSVISLFVGFMQLIPYVGAFLSLSVGFLLILMVDPMKAVVFAIMLIIVQQIEGQLIYPRVVGSSIGLPAIWTLLAALIGGALFNIVGVIFFIPFTSVIYTLLRDNMNDRLKQKRIKL